MFTQADAQWLSETIKALYAAQSVTAVAQTAMGVLDARFHALHSNCEELSRDAASYTVHGMRLAWKAPADYEAFIHDNPIIPIVEHCRQLPTIQLRQHASFSTWSQTDHFNGLAKPMGFIDQFSLIAQNSSSMVAVGLYRDTLFTEEESALAGLVQPHLAAVWRRVRGTEANPGAPGPLHLSLTAGKRTLSPSPVVQRTLRNYFPDWRGGTELPSAVRLWLDRSLADLRVKPPRRPLRALAVESARGRLIIRCFPGQTGMLDLVMMEIPARPSYFALQQEGLTARECEVLYWVSKGKRDEEIAIILGCASTTVSKHVQHLIAKLGATTRAAAVQAAGQKLA